MIPSLCREKSEEKVILWLQCNPHALSLSGSQAESVLDTGGGSQGTAVGAPVDVVLILSHASALCTSLISVLRRGTLRDCDHKAKSSPGK